MGYSVSFRGQTYNASNDREACQIRETLIEDLLAQQISRGEIAEGDTLEQRRLLRSEFELVAVGDSYQGPNPSDTETARIAHARIREIEQRQTGGLAASVSSDSNSGSGGNRSVSRVNIGVYTQTYNDETDEFDNGPVEIVEGYQEVTETELGGFPVVERDIYLPDSFLPDSEGLFVQVRVTSFAGPAEGPWDPYVIDDREIPGKQRLKQLIEEGFSRAGSGLKWSFEEDHQIELGLLTDSLEEIQFRLDGVADAAVVVYGIRTGVELPPEIRVEVDGQASEEEQEETRREVPNLDGRGVGDGLSTAGTDLDQENLDGSAPNVPPTIEQGTIGDYVPNPLPLGDLSTLPLDDEDDGRAGMITTRHLTELSGVSLTARAAAYMVENPALNVFDPRFQMVMSIGGASALARGIQAGFLVTEASLGPEASVLRFLRLAL